MSIYAPPQQKAPEVPRPPRSIALWLFLSSAFGLMLLRMSLSGENTDFLPTAAALSIAAGLVGTIGLALGGVRKGTQRPVSGAALAALHLFGLAALAATYGLVVRATYGELGEPSFGANGYIRLYGSADLALTLALSFGLWAAINLHRRATGLATHLAILALLTLTTVLLGPSFSITVTGSPHDSLASVRYTKCSLRSPCTGGEQVTLKAHEIRSAPKTARVICVDSHQRTTWIFQHTVTFDHRRTLESQPDDNRLEALMNACRQEADAAVQAGLTIESLVYAGDTHRFIDRALSSAERHAIRPLALEVEKLPETLRSQLEHFIPPALTNALTALDVMLISGVRDIPVEFLKHDLVLPHHRYMLFSAGIDEHPAIADTQHTSAPRRSRRNAPTPAPTFLQTPTAPTISNVYRTQHGNYSSYDYFVANRHCDLRYAQFLLERQLLPNTPHILNLLSNIGTVLYPVSRSRFDDIDFPFTDRSLGLPDARQLDDCVKLAAFYATHVDSFHILTPGGRFVPSYGAPNVYDIIYELADEGAARERLLARNNAVGGNPAALTQAIAEVLKPQPPSQEQFCAWTRSASNWLAVPGSTPPEVSAPLLALPEQWRREKVVYGWPYHFHCTASSPPSPPRGHRTQGTPLDHLNGTLRKTGLPCRAEQRYSHAPTIEVICTVEITDWLELPQS